MGGSVVISPVSAFRVFPIMGLSQQRRQGAGDGDSSTHSGKIPVQGGSVCGHSLPPQQSHHRFLRPGFKVGESREGDDSPHQHHASCLGLPLELRQASVLLNICTACRSVSACPGECNEDRGSEVGGDRGPACPASRGHRNPAPSCHGGKEGSS